MESTPKNGSTSAAPQYHHTGVFIRMAHAGKRHLDLDLVGVRLINFDEFRVPRSIEFGSDGGLNLHASPSQKVDATRPNSYSTVSARR